MPEPHPMALRERAVAAWTNGEGSQREIAKRFSIGLASLGRWISLKRETGTLEPLPMGGAHRPYVVDKVGEAIILGIFKQAPDRTLPEVCEAYKEATGITVSPQTMSDTVRRIGLTRKKGLFEPRSRSGRRS